jgi:hypothetical protein
VAIPLTIGGRGVAGGNRMDELEKRPRPPGGNPKPMPLNGQT